MVKVESKKIETEIPKEKDNPRNLPTLHSSSYKTARKMVKSKDYSIKRLNTLLIRILTRIDKVTIFLGQDKMEAKHLKTQISLLSQLLGVKKQVSLEIKELEAGNEKRGSSLSDILSK